MRKTSTFTCRPQASRVFFRIWNMGGVKQPYGSLPFPLPPFLSLPPFPLKPRGVVRKLGGINFPEGVWETPCRRRT